MERLQVFWGNSAAFLNLICFVPQETSKLSKMDDIYL